MKEIIYDNGSSKLEIVFDGEYYLISQEIDGVGSQEISVTKEDIERLFDFAHLV